MKRYQLKLFLLFLIFTIITTVSKSNAQNSNDRGLATNLFGFPFNDFSLYYNTTNDKLIRKSLSAGYMIAWRWWNAETGSTGDIEVNDDKYPIGAYNGPQIRIGLLKGRDHEYMTRYMGLQLIAKYLYYNDHKFVDWFSHDDAVDVIYIRSEKAVVFGAEWLIQNERPGDKLFLNTSLGFGLRVKFRDITTTKSVGSSGGINYAESRPVGTKHTRLFLPTINFGILIGTKLNHKHPVN
ncbi:MAG: hypothetical protein ABI772_15830 [Bacteroidota bacterium]